VNEGDLQRVSKEYRLAALRYRFHLYIFSDLQRQWCASMNVLWFLLVGVIAGWLAGVLVKGGGFGLIGDLVVGIIGALIGGLLFSGLGGAVGGGVLGSIVVATLGAVILLVILRLLKRA
jgi:uncharacterized membrane protein YeaQ/YmgE (transglycosylase-associated protein family)